MSLRPVRSRILRPGTERSFPAGFVERSAALPHPRRPGIENGGVYGHAGSQPLAKTVEDLAFEAVFLFSQLGL